MAMFLRAGHYLPAMTGDYSTALFMKGLDFLFLLEHFQSFVLVLLLSSIFFLCISGIVIITSLAVLGFELRL
jgi:hypothetical protein